MNCSNCGCKLQGTENICRFCGFKIVYPKSYKILILSITGKVKEENWKLSKENVKRFVDEDGIAYVMTSSENGELKYFLTEKNLWLETKKLWNETKLNEAKIPSWNELTENWKKYDQMFLRLSKETKIVEVLKKYGRKNIPEEIKEIFSLLLASGAGDYVSEEVIKDPKLLSEYLQMKAEGKSDLEIMYECRKKLDDL